MHAVTALVPKALVRAAAAAALAAAALGVAAAGGPPAAAASCTTSPRTCSTGNANGDTYTAEATAWALGVGGSGSSGSNACQITYHWGPGGPENWWPVVPAAAGHYEVRVTNTGRNGTYDIWIYCVQDGRSGAPPEHTDWEYDLQGFYFDIEPREPRDLVQEALAELTVGRPVVETSPGDGIPSLVGIRTHLMFQGGSVPQRRTADRSDGILTVEVWAEPDPSSDVIWDTGDGRQERCPLQPPVDPEDCSHEYERSSIDQPGAVDDQPAYEITASLAYVGGYRVLLDGNQIGEVVDLPGITLSSVPYALAVEEAQALNTGD